MFRVAPRLKMILQRPIGLWLILSLLACASPPSLGLATSGAAPLKQAGPAGELASAKLKRKRDDGRWGQRWCFGAGAPISGAPALGPEGQVYLATQEGYVHALAEDGTFRWSYTVKGAVKGAPVVQAGGNVVVATALNLLYTLRPNGTRLWMYRVPERLTTELSLSERGTLVFGAGERFVYAVSRRGGLVWRVGLKAAITTRPLLHEDGTVFIGTEIGLYTWKAPYQRTHWPSPPVQGFVAGSRRTSVGQEWLASGRVFSSNGQVELPGSLQFVRRLAGGETLAATQSHLLRLDAKAGTKLKVPLDAPPSGTPVLGGGGEIFVPSSDGTLRRIAPDGSSMVYARLGFSPLSELVLDRQRQRLLASVGEGQVCAVSLTRRRAEP